LAQLGRLLVVGLSAVALAGCTEVQTVQTPITATPIIDPSFRATAEAGETAQARTQALAMLTVEAIRPNGGSAGSPATSGTSLAATITSRLTAFSQPPVRPTFELPTAPAATPVPQPSSAVAPEPSPQPAAPEPAAQPTPGPPATDAPAAAPTSGLSAAQMTAVAQAAIDAAQTAAARGRAPQPTATPAGAR